MTLERISGHSMIAPTRDQVSSDLQGEAVILNFSSGVYYGLNAVGAFIWHLIQEPRTVQELLQAILDEYEVEPEECERDLLKLLEGLAAAGLVAISPTDGQ